MKHFHVLDDVEGLHAVERETNEKLNDCMALYDVKGVCLVESRKLKVYWLALDDVDSMCI